MCNGLRRVLFRIVKNVREGRKIQVKKIEDVERYILKPLIKMGELESSHLIAERCLFRDLTSEERDKIEDAKQEKEESENDFFVAIEILARTK